jgi:hypothetical protein
MSQGAGGHVNAREFVAAQLSERLRAAVATDHLRVERLSQRDLAGVGAG